MQLYFFLLLLSFQFSLSAFVNLEENKSDFVIATRKLNIPEFPDAFNPCIVRWKGKILMSFRVRDPETTLTNVIGVTWLDSQLKPHGPPKILDFKHTMPAGTMVQDPRLFVVADRLYIIYSNLWFIGELSFRRVFIAELLQEGEIFHIEHPEVFLHFDGIENNKFEKNWTPFKYNEDLLLVYSIEPHKIFMPKYGEKKCYTVAHTEVPIEWKWGELRGGTQAYLLGSEYLTFFHSSKLMRSSHSEGKLMPHYFMGAYTFESHPPFAIRKISPTFIVGEHFYEGPAHNTWKPLRVVFPAGYIFDDKYIWISYGRQDFESWLVKLDRKKFLNSLKPVMP